MGEKKNLGGQDQTLDLDVQGKIEEAIKQTQRGELGLGHWQDFVKHQNPFGVKFATEKQALKILGEQQFLPAEQVISAWNKLIKERRTNHNIPFLRLSINPLIRYSEETLESIAQDPAWFFIYDSGFSLRENRDICGTDPSPDHQPCHSWRNNDWWLSSREDFWATERGEPGYYLVRMKGLFPCDHFTKNQDWQEKQIREMGDEFFRAPSPLIANTCISIFLRNGKRLLEKYCHWGPEIESDGLAVYVGSFDRFGFGVHRWPTRSGSNDRLQVCVARRFDA